MLNSEDYSQVIPVMWPLIAIVIVACTVAWRWFVAQDHRIEQLSRSVAGLVTLKAGLVDATEKMAKANADFSARLTQLEVRYNQIDVAQLKIADKLKEHDVQVDDPQ